MDIDKKSSKIDINHQSNVVDIGSYAFKKYGAEHITLCQLSQAADAGLFAFAEDLEQHSPALLINFPYNVNIDHLEL